MIQETAFLQLSGLQHFSFCRRQWALIHIEQQWAENYRTTDGNVMHKKAHDGTVFERRGDTLITRDLTIASQNLGVSGKCDVVEFHRDPAGVTLPGQEGLWQPFPVEYKRGAPKADNCDALQLCGQAICLEEMLCCQIPLGALYYGETRHRTEVEFTPELRFQVKIALEEMHKLYQRGYTPKAKPKKGCSACSLKDICLPKLNKNTSVGTYLKTHMEELL